MEATKPSESDVRVRNSPVFKLKDKPNRQYQAFNMLQQFGFMPEVLIIEKVRGSNNMLILRAVLTPDELKKEEAHIKSLKERVFNGRTDKQPATK